MWPRLAAPVLAVLLWLGAGASAAAATGPARLSPESRERLAAAVTAYQAGDWKAAARGFAETSAAAAPIQEYALYLQADSLASLGDAAGARVVSVQAVERAGDGPLLPAALFLGAREASRSGDEATAVLLYRRFVERFPDHPDSAAARSALGQSLEAAGLGAEAVRVYRKLWLVAPTSPLAQRAAERQRVLAERGVTVPPATPRERVERAERLLAGGQAVAARGEAEAVVAEGPPADLTLRALRVVADSWRRAGRHDDALRAVDRALATAPAERRAPWLLDRARLTQTRGADQALATLDRLLREHPKSPEAPEALLLRAQILEAAGSSADAEAAYLRLAADYPEAEEAGAALWRLGWLSWFRSAPQESAQRWTRLVSLPGGQRLREAAGYWSGRAQAERGDAGTAARQWADLVASAPRTYYGVLAAARLPRDGAPAPREARPPVTVPPVTLPPVTVPPVTLPPVTLPEDPLETLRGDERYAKAEALREVGLGPFADGELADLARRSAGDPPRLYAVSAAFAQDARHHLSLRILRRDFFVFARTGHGLLPRRFWELFYPIGWRAELTSAAGRASLDPFFVAAVVREESSYDPRARSRVGARGLMQLMPETARPLARQHGFPFREGEVLDDPGVNLELGTVFMGRLVRDFGDPRLAVAAYNAGPRRVREWWAARRSDDMEVWVEQIPFNETRAFVKRVMLAWEEYRRLYGPRP